MYTFTIFFTVFTINFHFVIDKNYSQFLSGFYSFTKIDFLEPQAAHIDLCAINLFTTSFGVVDLLSFSFNKLNSMYLFF